MTFLSCLGIGIAFAIAVALLVLAGVLLGWALPAAIARSRGTGQELSMGKDRENPGRDPGETDSDLIDPPGPRA
jgi:hypothetical protein